VSYVDDLRNIMLARLDESEDALDFAERHGPTLIRAAVRAHLATILVPDWVENRWADIIIEGLMDLIAYARKALAMQRTMVLALGSPDALDKAADLIGQLVGKVAGDLAIEVRQDSLAAINDPSRWQGQSAASYEKGFDGQADAVRRIAQLSSQLEDALRSMSDTIEGYYVALMGTVVSIVGVVLSVVGAILTAPTGVGFFIGIIGAIVSVIGAVTSVVQMVIAQNQVTDSTIRPLQDTLVLWPKAEFAT
jgi:uncharacterized protein YukE